MGNRLELSEAEVRAVVGVDVAWLADPDFAYLEGFLACLPATAEFAAVQVTDPDGRATHWLVFSSQRPRGHVAESLTPDDGVMLLARWLFLRCPVREVRTSAGWSALLLAQPAPQNASESAYTTVVAAEG